MAHTKGVLKSMLLAKLKTMVISLGLLLVVCAAIACGQNAGNNAQAPQDRLEVAWADLASTDESRSARALLQFAASPKEATAFLKNRLKPVRVDPERFGKLVARLEDERFQVREMAYKELEAEVTYLGKFAKPIVEKSMADAGQESKNRLRRLLEQIPADVKPAQPAPKLTGRSVAVNNVNGNIKIVIDGVPLDLAATAPPPVLPNTAWLRAVRATALLESLATPDARAIIDAVATGETEATPTREAKAALERLGTPRP